MKNILIDLLKRETANFSADFSNALVRKLKPAIMLSRDPQRVGGLQGAEADPLPPVLVELGYLSHLEDEKLLNSADWQKQVAASIAAGGGRLFQQARSKRSLTVTCRVRVRRACRSTSSQV